MQYFTLLSSKGHSYRSFIFLEMKFKKINAASIVNIILKFNHRKIKNRQRIEQQKKHLEYHGKKSDQILLLIPCQLFGEKFFVLEEKEKHNSLSDAR